MGLLAGLALIAMTPGCSDGPADVMAPETDTGITADEAPVGRAAIDRHAPNSVARALDRFVEAYNTRNVRELGTVLHRKYRFISSQSNPDVPPMLMYRDVLTAARTMFTADDVTDVTMSLDYELPPTTWHRRTLVVDATVTLEVTTQNAFGPPVVYLVDQHPARFVLHKRGWHARSPWVILVQRDLYEPGGTERTVLPRTFSEVLEMFLER